MFVLSLGILIVITISSVVATGESQYPKGDFTIINGQIFTPGLAIVDSPQPFTPMGGDTLEVALDVSGDGKISLPPYSSDDESQIHNITIFLFSYDTGRNFTISNATRSTPDVQSLGDIMFSEPGSTVKHVRWTWPDCLVGDGQPSSPDSARGAYNISLHQSFRINSTEYYTIFDLPIYVTNSISQKSRPSCDSLNNRLLSPEAETESTDPMSFQPLVGGDPSNTGSEIPPLVLGDPGNNSNSDSRNGNPDCQKDVNGDKGIDSSCPDLSAAQGLDSFLDGMLLWYTVSWLAVTAFFISL